MHTYRIVTPRFVIRCYDPAKSDAQLLLQSINESLDHLKPWMPWAWHEPEILAIKQERVILFNQKFVAGEDFPMGVFNLSETKLIGSCGFHTRLQGNAREIGYWVGATDINKGYATDIVTALLHVAFEIQKSDRFEIHCDAKNKPSARVSEKSGFILKDVLIANAKDVYGNDRDTMVWEITSTQYNKQPLVKPPVKAFDKMGKEIFNSA